jgi:hypothetical protein
LPQSGFVFLWIHMLQVRAVWKKSLASKSWGVIELLAGFAAVVLRLGRCAWRTAWRLEEFLSDGLNKAYSFKRPRKWRRISLAVFAWCCIDGNQSDNAPCIRYLLGSYTRSSSNNKSIRYSLIIIMNSERRIGFDFLQNSYNPRK